MLCSTHSFNISLPWQLDDEQTHQIKLNYYHQYGPPLKFQKWANDVVAEQNQQRV